MYSWLYEKSVFLWGLVFLIKKSHFIKRPESIKKILSWLHKKSLILWSFVFSYKVAFYKKKQKFINIFSSSLLQKCAQIWYRRSRNYRSTSCPWEASRERRRRALPLLVSSSLLLHARTTRPTSPYSPRFLLAMLFLDFTLSVFESKLRIVFWSTPCKRGAKQTKISNLRNMLFKKQHFFSRYFVKNLPKINI